MHVYLVQHGQAKSEELDPERHLTERGVADVKKTASFLRPLKLPIHSVWQSGKTRAAQTADILAAAVGPDAGVVRRHGLAPNDPVDPIVKELLRAPDDVMIVGHLPLLSKLASALVAGEVSREIVAFQQGGVVCLGSIAENRERWRVEWMIAPDLLP